MRDKFNKFWGEFKEIIKKKEMSILPGHLAYYFLISTIPAFALTFYIASCLHLSVDIISNFLSSIFTQNVANYVLNLIGETSLNLKNVFFLLIAFYVASNAAKSIITASNTIFNIRGSNVVKKRIKSFVITIFIILLITFILVFPLFGNTILKLFSLIGIDSQVLAVLNLTYPVLKWPITLFVVFLFIKLIYTMAPEETVPSSYVNKGAIFTTISWSLATAAFSFYINNFADYTKLYGALSNIVILMLWLWIISYIFVIGLALNCKNLEEENEKTNTIKLKEIQNKIRNIKKTKLK